MSDPEKRRQYDQYGHAAFEGGAGASGFDFNSFDMGDIFGDIFGDLFGTGRSRSRSYNGPSKGADVQVAVRLTFEDAVFGCEKEIELTMKDPCPTCNGTGAKQGTSPVTCSKCGGRGQVEVTKQSMFGMLMRSVQTCPDCNGTGKIIKEMCPDCNGNGYKSALKKIKVSIPAGISNGQSVRLRGKGEPGKNGGPRGDLLVQVRVSEHPFLQRDGVTLYSTAPISFAQAALGGDIRISTIDGDVLFPIKSGTQTDTRIRLKNKGVPYLNNPSVRGDQIVTLVVQVPDRLTKEQKEALIAFDMIAGNSLNTSDSDDGSNKGKKKKKGIF